ncbi:MAG: hypothetical protein AB7K86_05390 [Rhodospirillales bacterium]
MERQNRKAENASRTPRQLGEADAKAQHRAAARQTAFAWRMQRPVADRSPESRRHIRAWESRR